MASAPSSWFSATRETAVVEEAVVSVVFILWLREIKRYTRSRAQIIASLGQPTLYLVVLGFGLGPTFRQAGNGSYLQFLAPGVVGMTILFSSIFSGVGLLFDRQFGFLKETLVAPVPRLQIMIGRTLGGATVAMLQGTLMLLVCLIAGFRPVSLAGGLVFIGWAVYHRLYGSRHRVRVGMRTGMAGLGLWSFLMASAHGAGLMLVPILVRLGHAGSHAGHLPAGESLALALTAVGVHTLATPTQS